MAGMETEIARLKHKDVKIRRRAVRHLFDNDNPGALKGFVPLLDDKDPWFRNKSLDAHRKWAKSQEYQDILAGKYTREIESEGTKKLTTVTIDEPVGLECPKCFTVQSSGNFCKKCSASLTKAKPLCTGCLNPVSESSAFCGSCGKNLTS